ncbi:MAG: hypothetical protein FWE07_01200 [Turicibacter sp.]|nr:hypothetical protein [Turicibacter sp.]
MRKKYLVLTAIFSLILIACQASNSVPRDAAFFSNERSLPQELAEFDINISELESGGGLVVVAYGGDIYVGGELEAIYLNNPREPLSVIVLNGADGYEDITYVLKLFYNFEEVAFRIRGSEEYITEFVFTIDVGYRLDIPIYLDLPHESTGSVSKLTVGLFVDPEQHIGILDEMDRDADFELFWEIIWALSAHNVLNLEINYDLEEEQKILLLPEFEEAITLSYDMPFGTILVTQMFDLPERTFEDDFIFLGEFEDELVLYHLQASPEERIELAFLVNLQGAIAEPVSEILIIAMLDWQQIDLHGQSYLWMSADPDEFYRQTFGHFFIDVPAESGLYELVLFAVANPTSPLSRSTHFPLEVRRLTIEVVE